MSLDFSQAVCPIGSLDSAQPVSGNIFRMPEERHIQRQEKLRALVDAAKRQRSMSQLAYAVQVLGYKDGKYLSQMLGALDQRGSRPMGDETARYLDEKLKMPGYFLGNTKPADTIREFHAITDEEVRQMVLRELVRSMVANVPAVAEGFAALLRESAQARHFEMDAGLIGIVLDTVALGQSSAAASIRRALQSQSSDPSMPKKVARSRRSRT